VVPPTTGGLERTPAAPLGHWLHGCDATTGIVSVDADSHGRAHVWRRFGSQRAEVSEERFPNWFLTTSLELLAHLPARHMPADVIRDAHGQLSWSPGITVIELDGAPDAEDAYRYLVLTDQLAEVENAMVETANKGPGDEAQSLADLRGLVLVWHPIEQFLMLSGRTYFNGMQFGDLRRLQFDLETTGLDDERDRIFMVSMRESSGWNVCLDTTSLSEGQLIERLVEMIKQRDPDVLENHNIFAFDLPFLARRASRLGVPLRLGRDGSEPELETDVFDGAEPFLRWRVRGREVVDTQQAVRRYGAAAPDLRRHGLKDAARYFGLARTEREYVQGAEIWPTYQTDPERIRRYAADDVLEVDGLSSRLLPSAFRLAQLLPRAYERIAADQGPVALWEPLLVRAYLHEGQAIAAPMPRQQRAADGPAADLRIRGVVANAARARFERLLPCVIADDRIRAANDDLSAMPGLLRYIAADDQPETAAVLAQTSFAYLAGHSLFSDPDAANTASQRAGHFVEQLLADLEARGCRIVEADGEQVLFAVPTGWTAATEQDVVRRAETYLPRGVRLQFPEHFQALYARAPRSTITLGVDGSVVLLGSTFRAGRLERFGEDFLRSAAPLILTGDTVGLRQLFLHTVHSLRMAQVSLEDLSVQATLYRSPPQYRRSGIKEEPYQVLLAAGVRAWRIGQRIRYFRTHGGEPVLLQEGASRSPAEADAEYYVQRLVSVYCAQFAHAFRKQDFARLFRVPGRSGPYEEHGEGALSGIQVVAERIQ
jgi:DNA polymerase, archaea type